MTDRSVALLQAAAVLYASLTVDSQGIRLLDSDDGEIGHCVSLAEKLLKEVEIAENE